MGEQYQPYYDERNCVKCGSATVQTKYEPSVHVDTYTYKELMRRTCECGYEWFELPLDHKVER